MRRCRGALGQCSLLSCLSGLDLCVVCVYVRCGYEYVGRHAGVCIVCVCVLCVCMCMWRKGKKNAKEQVKRSLNSLLMDYQAGNSLTHSAINWV